MRDRLIDLAEIKAAVQRMQGETKASYARAAAANNMAEVSRLYGMGQALKAVLELFPS